MSSDRDWYTVWHFFGYEPTERQSAYQITENSDDADYIFGWYFYYHYGDNQEMRDTLLRNAPRHSHSSKFREMGWEDSKFHASEHKIDEVNHADAEI